MARSYPIRQDSMLVSINSKYIYISLESFMMLFENSHVYYLTKYRTALERKMINVSNLIELSRKARIPYSLFFAPKKVVEENIKRNNDALFQGVDPGLLLMAGRGNVEIKDIDLIVKDIRKRQLLLTKYNKNTPDNILLNMRTEDDIELKARAVTNALGISIDKLHKYRNKSSAYKYLVKSLENANILISRSQRGAMPQSINKKVNFSGIAVRHRKYPTIFLYSKDESMVGDPTGRRIFSIILLAVCISAKKFSPVTYDSNVKNSIETDEYRIAEEILAPRAALEGIIINSVEDVRRLADAFKVTPSMMLMRLSRLNVVTDDELNMYFSSINDERRRAVSESKNISYKINDTTKVIDYNGQRFTTEIINLWRNKIMSNGDARRILLFNKRPTKFLDDLGAKL